MLIEPATERLLEISKGDVVLDIACGAGRFSRRMAELGADVVAFDQCASFIERAYARTKSGISVEYHVVNAMEARNVESLGVNRFDKAVCTMALMDMAEIGPILRSVKRMLKPSGRFVFSVMHPCFNSPGTRRFTEAYDDDSGRSVARSGIDVFTYLTPFAKKGEGIVGQPEPQYYYHRSISILLRACFEVGFVMDGIEEPGFPVPEKTGARPRWEETPEIPPVLIVRMQLANPGK